MFRNQKRITIQILKYVIGCGLIFCIIKSLLVGDENREIPKFNDLEKLLVSE